MKPILTFILLMTFSFTLTSESSAQPPWKEQMKRQQEFERENAKRFREINREQQKRSEEIFRERGKTQAEFERESFKNYAEQQRAQLKGWEEQQRFYAEQQREQFQDQREFERDFSRDRGRLRNGFLQSRPFGGNGFVGNGFDGSGFARGYGFQQPVPGVFQPGVSDPRSLGFALPPLGHQNEGGQVFQYGHPSMGQNRAQVPVQVPGGILLNTLGSQPFQQGAINEGPVLNGPGETVLRGNDGAYVLQPENIPPYQNHGPIVPPINYGPMQR